MRLNVFLAQHTTLSRRSADTAIAEGRVAINGQVASLGQTVDETADRVALDGRAITPSVKTMTIMLNKPVGYVCSKAGQGSKTIYALLPDELHHLNPVGRLDKDSSGLLLMTNDGQLANQLTHPRYQKTKIYEVHLDKPLTDSDVHKLSQGIVLEDGISKLGVQQLEISNQKLAENEPLVSNSYFQITMTEGRNRQIRRTFESLGYQVRALHRTNFGNYSLGSLRSAQYKAV
jgi:23S rRNA pseudouridine2605 synthase